MPPVETTARSVITDARDLHPSFDRHQHPDLTLLRQLSGYQQVLISKALIRYPDLFSEDVVIALPLGDFAAGYPLDDPLMIHDVEALPQNGRRYGIEILPAENRHGPRPPHSVYVLNRTLFQCGVPADWTGVVSLTVKFSQTVPELTSLDDLISLPVEARQALHAQLGKIMAMRGSQRRDVPAPNVQAFQADAAAAEEDFLKGLWLQRSATSGVRREVV